MKLKLPEPTARVQRFAARSDTPARWYEIKAAADEPSKASVYIYDAIGGWFGVWASDFVREINALDVDEIELHLNSPGGDVWDGTAIYNALRQHKAKITVSVDGIAASIASVIAMAGDEIIMATGSQMMIHDASTIAYANAGEMRDIADVLDKVSDSISTVYAKRAGGAAATWRETMRAETWYTAQEAVDAGLADRLDDTNSAENVEARFDLSIFAHAGRSDASAPTRAPKPPATPADPTTPSPEGPNMELDQFLAGLCERLGVTDAQTDEAGILAALDETLTEHAEPTPELPKGTVAISQAVLDELTAKAARGDQARTEQLNDERERLVTAALSEGRIKPTDAADWRTQLANQDGTLNQTAAKILGSLAKGAAVPVSAIGYTGGVEESTDDEIYAKAWGTPAGEDA